MPKKPAEACMFCGGTPCQCGDSGRTKKRPKASGTKASSKAPKPSPKSKTTSPSVDTDSKPTEDVFGGIPDAKKSKFKPRSTPEKDLQYLSALRNLRDIVSEPDKRWIDRQIKPVPSLEVGKKLAAWRKRNETQQGD